MGMLRVTKISFIALLLFITHNVLAANEFPQIELELLGKPYQLEIADTRSRQLQGLMYRTSLPPNHGMLFVYNYSAYHRIWMKNTLIPLTVLWLDENAVVIEKRLLQPCRFTQCRGYGAHKASRYIVELPEMAFDNFVVGDQLQCILTALKP